MKFTRELKVGFSAMVGIILLILGVNFLKCNSFFGGDLEYHSYFENSGQLAVSSNVTLNGVIVVKVKKVIYVPNSNPKKRVKITIQFKDDETGKHFLPPMISKYACKISKILENIKNAVS